MVTSSEDLDKLYMLCFPLVHQYGSQGALNLGYVTAVIVQVYGLVPPEELLIAVAQAATANDAEEIYKAWYHKNKKKPTNAQTSLD